MKAPDKIYIQQDMINNIPLEQKEFDDDVEYIRKDLLLEWAKGEMMPGNSAEGKGWNLALQTLIDKINSL